MTRNRRAVALFPLAALVLLVVASAQAGPQRAHRSAADSITGSYVATATGARLTIKNNGSTTLLFDRGSAPEGKQITAATQDGVPCRIFAGQFGCGQFSMPPNATATIDVTIPGAARSIQVLTGPFVMYVLSDGKTEFWVDWTLRCTGAKTGGCRGEIQAQDPVEIVPVGAVATDMKIVSNKRKPYACYGSCARLLRGSLHFVGKSKNDLKRKNRAGKKFEIHFKLWCADKDGPKKQLTSDAHITLVYDKRGFTDRKLSDLNANGKPDGKEKK